MRRVWVGLGMIFSNMFWRSISICSKLPAPRIETGAIDRPGKVISTSRSSSSPAASRALHLLARPLAAVGGLAGRGRLALGPGRRRGGRRQEQVEQPLLDPRLGLLLDPLALASCAPATMAASTRSRIRPSTSRPHVADLGVLGRLGLHERRADEHRQPAGDLGLAHAGRADQHDVLGRHLPAQVLGELPAPPPVPQRDRDGALGVGLAHDVAVQLGDDLAGRQLALAPCSCSRSGTAVPPPSGSRSCRCRSPPRSSATRGRSPRPRASECWIRARAAARA